MAQPSGDFVMPTADLPAPPIAVRVPEKCGRARCQVTAICCPECGSVHVVRRTSRTGRAMAWWKCQEPGCGFMWKEQFQVGRGSRAAVALL
jgi:hypothetical protein